MSGHSKWSTIKHKKAATDAKRSAVFSKLANALTISARQRGGDPSTNHELRTLMEKAKEANMPKDKIENAVKKGTGELNEGVQLDELLMEAYGPGGVAILVTAITDNRNRTTAEVKHALSKNGGKFAGEGSVQWMFKQLGVLDLPAKNIDDKETFELEVIDMGAEEIKWSEDKVHIYTPLTSLQDAYDSLSKKGFSDIETGIEWVPQNTVSPNESENKKLENLYEALDDLDDVQEIYSNTTD